MRVEIGDKNIFKKILLEKFKVKGFELKGITFDSRRVEKNDIFLALKGKQVDGHEFIDDALNNGASIVFSEKESKDSRVIYKESTKDVLRILASNYRRESNCKIIAITGSNGKTTTKEILYHTIRNEISCIRNIRNYNSTLGMPMSIFQIMKDTDYCILEMGTNEKGEIKYLCDIAKPDIGLLTNISETHLENFHTVNNITIEKSYLFNSLSSDGTAFINNDDINIVKGAKRTKAKKISFGFNMQSDYFATSTYDNNIININNQSICVPYNNKAFINNALPAFSIANYLGISADKFQYYLTTFSMPQGRFNIINSRNFVIIDDCYNANYASTISGIDSLLSINRDSNSERKIIIVFGDMLELGEKEKKIHYELGNYISKARHIDALFTIGNLSKEVSRAIKSSIYNKHFTNQQELIAELKNYSQYGDIIYFKGSRSMKLEIIIEKL